jgi:hypothetical protein
VIAAALAAVDAPLLGRGRNTRMRAFGKAVLFISRTCRVAHGCQVSKWHLGFMNWNMTPTWRGFNSFYGYYNGTAHVLPLLACAAYAVAPVYEPLLVGIGACVSRCVSFAGAEDYFTHSLAAGLDLHLDVGSNCGQNCRCVWLGGWG